MLPRIVLLFAFATLAWAEDSKKSSESYYDPYGYYSGVSTYAGNGYASVGGGISPFFDPFVGFGIFHPAYRRTPYPFWPFWPSIPQIIPWYKGPNVCVDTKYMDEPEEMKDFLKDVRDFPSSYEHMSESCQGTESAYVCYGRKMYDGESKFYVTKYQCCHGFVRATGQAGCVESKKGRNNPETNPGNPVELEDSSRYDVDPKAEQ